MLERKLKCPWYLTRVLGFHEWKGLYCTCPNKDVLTDNRIRQAPRKIINKMTILVSVTQASSLSPRANKLLSNLTDDKCCSCRQPGRGTGCLM